MSTYSSQASPPSSSAQAGVPGPGPPGYSYNPPTQPLPAQAQQPPPYTQYAGYAQAPQNQRKTRQQLEEEVAEKLKRELKDFYTKLQGELDSEFRTQAELSEHSNRVRETIQRLDSVRTALQDASTKIQLQTFELQGEYSSSSCGKRRQQNRGDAHPSKGCRCMVRAVCFAVCIA